jgi:hypothetical protein
MSNVMVLSSRTIIRDKRGLCNMIQRYRGDLELQQGAVEPYPSSEYIRVRISAKRRTNSEYDKLPLWPLKSAPLLTTI